MGPHRPIETIPDETTLDDLLSEPTEEAVAAIARGDGDLIVLGVGGKMGPSLAWMARRAVDRAGSKARVLGVSRFSDSRLPAWLADRGIEPIACDLLDPDQLERLPEAPRIVFMAGMKFGTSADPSMTWAMNTLVPAMVARRYRSSRIVAFSTGNVYGLTSPDSGGATEADPPDPRGEYAMSCLGRERLLDHASRSQGTPVAILRLNYANEPRYGVLADLARTILDDRPIDLTMGHVNLIWQGDANAMALRAFDLAASPARILNLSGPETVSVRELAIELGQLLDRPVMFVGSEADDSLLNRANPILGSPRVPLQTMIQWIADWIARGGRSLGKPTHFQVRDGGF